MTTHSTVWPGIPLPKWASGTVTTSHWHSPSAIAIMMSFTVALVTAALSSAGGFAGACLREWPAYLAVVGSGWATYWYLWAVRVVPRTVDEGARVIISNDRGDPHGTEAARRVMTRLGGDVRRIPIVPVAGVIAAAIVYAVVATHIGHSLSLFPKLSERHSIWVREPHLWIKNLLLGCWSVALLVPMLSAASLALKYFFALAEFTRYERRFRQSVPIAREAFRRITYFPTWGGLAWTGGALLIALSLVPDLHSRGLGHNVVSVLIVAVLVLFGVGGILWPEIRLHAVLDRMRSGQIDDIAKALAEAETKQTSITVDELTKKIEDLHLESPWVHAYGVALGVCGEILIPIAPVVVAAYVHTQH